MRAEGGGIERRIMLYTPTPDGPAMMMRLMELAGWLGEGGGTVDMNITTKRVYNMRNVFSPNSRASSKRMQSRRQ